MSKCDSTIGFKANLCRPAANRNEDAWSFLILPKDASERLPRRGRTTVAGRINGHPFQATLEPDGQRSHWLRLDRSLSDAAGLSVGDTASLEIEPVIPEPEPAVPEDLAGALAESPQARAAWDETTTIARLDWIHWIESAKQAQTRKRRVANACDMLASGKKRVCCFDPSGFYSKAIRAPEAADAQD